jgi:hypothetical protein
MIFAEQNGIWDTCAAVLVLAFPELHFRPTVNREQRAIYNISLHFHRWHCHMLEFRQALVPQHCGSIGCFDRSLLCHGALRGCRGINFAVFWSFDLPQLVLGFLDLTVQVVIPDPIESVIEILFDPVHVFTRLLAFLHANLAIFAGGINNFERSRASDSIKGSEGLFDVVSCLNVFVRE